MSTTVNDIRTTALSKNFGHITALSDLNLKVPRGTIFGYLGPNGSGKTTTVRILSGLLNPSSGNAYVCEYDLRTQKDEIKASTGLLPETPGLYSKLSAVEYLEFIGALYDMKPAAMHGRIDRLLAILGLEGRQDDLLESYSSGMKQKVLVASTLIHEPRLIFLDEPIAGLDPAASALVRDLILALTEETQTTFFICTHITSFAEEICTNIGLLKSGNLVAVGTPDELIDRSGTQDLEEMYLKIIGGEIEKTKLLDWRE
jgi:ABC-2 type transport system ATP-binding protein